MPRAAELSFSYVTNNFPNLAWTFGCVKLFLSPITIVGNGFVLASILHDPFQNIRSAPSSYIIFNLAIADLLVGVLLEPLFAISVFYSAINHTELFSDYVLDSTTYVLLGVSFCSLVHLSFDRLRAIRTPLQYACTASRKKIRNVNILVWIYFTILAVTPGVFQISFVNTPTWLYISTAHMVTVSVVLSILNIAVVLSVRDRGKIIKKMVDSENAAVLQSAFNREKAVTRTTGIMVLVFLICLTPLALFSSLQTLLLDVNMKVREILTWMYFSGLALAYLNSLINPLLYAWRLPKYRRAFYYIFNHIKNRISVGASQSKTVPLSRVKHNEIEHKERTLCHLVENGFRECTSREKDTTVKNTKL